METWAEELIARAQAASPRLHDAIGTAMLTGAPETLP